MKFIKIINKNKGSLNALFMSYSMKYSYEISAIYDAVLLPKEYDFHLNDHEK